MCVATLRQAITTKFCLRTLALAAFTWGGQMVSDLTISVRVGQETQR